MHYLRHHTIRILKVETKTIQMRPNVAGYTSGRGYSIFRAFWGLVHYSKYRLYALPMTKQ